MWLTQSQNFITTRTIITALNPQFFDVDWFVANYIEKHMQLHHGSDKKAVLAHLSRHVQSFSTLPLPPVEQNVTDDAVVTTDDAQVRAYLEQQCSKDIKGFHAGHQVIFHSVL